MPDRSILARPTETAAPDGAPLVARLRGWANRSREQLRLRLLGPDFEQRLSHLRERYGENDEYGLDVSSYNDVARVFGFLHRLYFRTEVHGIDHLPAGRVLIVANHSGQLPLDAVILGCSLFFDAETPRALRATIDRWAMTLPYVSTFYKRLGSVVGSPENARRLLERDEAVLVFPEGIRGISKPFAHRYQLQPFGNGFMRLALATGAPILPVAVIGAEEQYVNLGNFNLGAKLARAPVCPVIPQMLLPFGQLPLPTKYRLFFGEPMHFERDSGQTELGLSHKVFLVRQAIQSLMTEGLRQRRGVFF